MQTRHALPSTRPAHRPGWASLLLSGALPFMASTADAQVSAYNFSQSNGTYTAITGTDIIASTWNDNLATYTFPSGTFTFNGNSYGDVKVNSNGYVTFGSTLSLNTGYSGISTNRGYDGAVAAFSRDLINNGSTIVGTQSGAEIIIQWTNARRYQGAAMSGDVLNFQIRLNQATGVINLVYGTCSATSTSSRTCQVGLRGAGNTDYNNRSSSTSWSTTIAGSSNSSNVTSLNTIMPASGLTFTWSPANSVGPTALALPAAANCYGTGETVAVTVKNFGGTTLNFASTPVTVTTNVTGAATASLSGTLSTGTLAPGATVNVPMSATLDMSAGGTYNFAFTSSMGGDTNAGDDNAVDSRNSAAPTGVTAGSNLATVCAGGTVDLSSTGSTSGLQTVFNENFNGPSPPAGWTTTNTGTGGTPANAAWTLRADGFNAGATFHSNDASQFYLSNSDAQGNGSTTRTTLASPAFSLANYTTASLNFWHYYRDVGDAGDTALVEISLNGGSTWTLVQAYTTTQGAVAAFTNSNLNLNAYAGQASVMLRFRFRATWDWYWALDNMSVSGIPLPTFSWSSNPPGFTSALQNPTSVAVTTNTTFIVTVSALGCSAMDSVAVAAVAPPNAGVDGSTTLCESSGAVNLFPLLGGSPDGGGTWNGGSIPGTFNPATDTAGTYTYTVAPTAPCASSDVSQVVVSVVALPNAGVDGSVSLCSSDGAVNLFPLLGGSPDGGGTWSGGAVPGTFDPSSDVAGTFTYTVAPTSPCAVSDVSQVVVGVTPAPDAGSNSSYVTCNGAAPFSLLALLGGTPQAGGSWSGPSTVVADIYDPSTMTPGSYLYTVMATSPCTGSASASVAVSESGNQVVLRINTDGNASQTSWAVSDALNNVIATGGPYTAAENNSQVDEMLCLSNANGDCYGLQLFDSFGDGLGGVGNWQLRTAAGKVLLGDDFGNGLISPSASPLSPSYGSKHAFCLPAGPADIAATECGIFTNLQGNKVYSTKVTGATQYQFEFSNPDAGFIRRIVRTTNYVHFWDMVANPLVPGVHYFARVRTNVAGPVASAHFGGGCEMGLAPTVPCSDLIMAPAYGHSCNETRAFNPSTNNSFIYAIPVQGATEYQFRIFNISEGYDQTFIRNTYILQLKWNNNVAPPLANGSTYDVEMNVKVGGVYSGFCPSSCTITIVNAPAFTLASMEQPAFGTATLWPNPVRDGQVHLSITGLSAGSPSDDHTVIDQQITVDVQDIYGKQVFAREFGNSGGQFSTVLQLPGDIASGVYLVNITVNLPGRQAGGKRTVQRLSIIR